MAQNPPEENSWMFAHVCTKSSVPEQLLQDDHFGIDREKCEKQLEFFVLGFLSVESSSKLIKSQIEYINR